MEGARAAARAISHAISSTAAEARRRGAIDSEFGAEVGWLITHNPGPNPTLALDPYNPS